MHNLLWPSLINFLKWGSFSEIILAYKAARQLFRGQPNTSVTPVTQDPYYSINASQLVSSKAKWQLRL